MTVLIFLHLKQICNDLFLQVVSSELRHYSFRVEKDNYM